MAADPYFKTDFKIGILGKGKLPELKKIEKVLEDEKAKEEDEQDAEKIKKLTAGIKHLKAIGEDTEEFNKLIAAVLKEGEAWAKAAVKLDADVKKQAEAFKKEKPDDKKS